MKYTSNKSYVAHSCQKGVTMIEAIVSLLLFTIGALGLAAMQLSSVAASGDSQQQTVAVWKAQEFIDRIRSNPGLEADYITAINNNTVADLGTDTASKAFTCPAAVPTNCNSGTCTAAQLVAFDVWEVFCDPDTGAAKVSSAASQTGAGSSGLNQLEVILFRNADPDNGDLELYLEWVSLEADANEGITNANANGSVGAAKNIQVNLCDNALVTLPDGTVSDTRVTMDSRLDAYCVRFR